MPHRFTVVYVRFVPILGILVSCLASAQTSCSFTHTNHSCTLTLDRNSFVFPPALQMYPGQIVTVQMQNGKNFEVYTLDPAPGQANVLPDVTSAALGNLNTILAAASSLGPARASPVPQTSPTVVVPAITMESSQGLLGSREVIDPCKVTPNGEACKKHKADPCVTDPKGVDCRGVRDAELADAIVKAISKEKADEEAQKKRDAIEDAKKLKEALAVCTFEQVSQFSDPGCMIYLLRGTSEDILRATLPSKGIYLELQRFITPDAQTLPATTATLPDLLAQLCGVTPSPSLDRPCALGSDDGLIRRQAIASANAAALLSRITKPPSQQSVPPSQTYNPLPTPVLKAMQLVAEEQAALDAIRKDLEGYASRIQDLILDPANPPGPVIGTIHDTGPYDHSSRTVNSSLNRLNLVSNSQEAANDGSKKALIVTIAVVYGEARWEASSGVALAFRPIRTFTVAPIISSAGLQTGSYINQSKAGPQVVPFVSADFRVGDDFKISGWRAAIYATGGVGYNISQESADYLVGPSISWRGVLLSALCDFGNGTRLGQGLTAGQMLPGTPATPTTPFTPSSIATLPTTNHIVPAFTVAVSVRIPGITGR